MIGVNNSVIYKDINKKSTKYAEESFFVLVKAADTWF